VLPTRVPVRRARTEQRWSWVDLRLVPAAGTVWALTLAAPHVPVAVLLTGAAGAAVGGAVVLVRSRRAAASVLLTCLAAVTLAGTAAAVREHARSVSPLAGLAERQAVVPVVLELSDDPRQLAGAGLPRVLVRADLVEAGGLPIGGAPVLLFGPAGEWAGLLPGQTVRLRAGVRAAEPGDDVHAVLSARSPPEPVGGPGAVQDAAGALRRGLADSAARVLPPRPAGLLPGLVVGDTTGMDPVLTAEFRRAGLAHLTAVSGLNVG
jgi:competence protein ComEC